MSEFPLSRKLLSQVAWRLYSVRIAKRFAGWFLAAAIVFAVALAVSRVTGFIPDVFELWTLALVPAAAAVCALLFTRFPKVADAARQTDTRQGTKDLYLTLTMLDRSAGEYKPLVGQDAERRARELKAPKVVPFTWERPAVLRGLSLPAAIGALALAILFLPALDLSGVQAQAKEQENLARKIAETRKAIEIRKTTLQQKNDLENENSEDVEQALEKLQADFQRMKKNEKIENAQRLAVNQRALGDKWRKLNSDQLKGLMNEEELDQQFGSPQAQEMRQWQRELQEGSSESLEKALEAIKEDLQQLARTEDPVERAEMARKIEKQLREMSDFATDKAGSQSLAGALQKAQEQMEALRNSEGELDKEAMQALQESLDLSQMEAENLAQAARDMKSLEEAMELVSMAKELNSEEMLDGEGMEGAQSLEDYKEMYAQMMAEMGEGEGELGGEGIGEGGEAPEDDSVKTDFVNERSKSAVQKGKVLLSMKTKGMSDSGEARKEYRQAMSDIKQDAAEAIDSEEIPPGYVDAVKGYFDKLEDLAPLPEEALPAE